MLFNNATTDDEIDAIIKARVRANKWPVAKNSIKCFSEQDLVKFRLYNSNKYHHHSVEIADKSKMSYRLCTKGRLMQRVCFMCVTCKVPLCNRPRKDEDMSHDNIWHMALDLQAEHEKAVESLEKLKEMEKKKGVEARENLEKRKNWGRKIAEEGVTGESAKEEAG